MNKLLGCLMLAVCGWVQAASQFEFSNSRGPYAVGLNIVQQYDYARIYKGKIDMLSGLPERGERARPLQTLVWYPAQAGGTPVRYGDYIRSAVSEENFALGGKEVDELTRNWVAQRWDGLSADRIEQEMQRPMWAVAKAAPASGRFPIVIYAPSFSASAHENADLCEYLSSQGYIVLATPSMGAHGRDMTHDLEGVETQAADIGYLIAYSRTLPHADASHIAVVGYSWGGMANVLAAAKDNRIGALVSLDGSVRYFPTLVNSAKYVTPGSISAPLLFVAARPGSIEELITYKQDLSGSLLNQLKYNDWHKLTAYPMVHANFTSEYQRFALDSGWGFGEYSRAETSQAYSLVARYVHRFLDAYLKQDAAALAFIKQRPEANGAPAHWLVAEHHASTGAAPTLESFAAALGTQGFDHAPDIYRALQKKDSAFALDEASLRHWGYQLLRANRNAQAIEIFKLATVLFPASWNAYDCLAEAYQQNRDDALAIENYRRSLELDPKNDNAVQHLKLLNERVSKKE